MPSALLPTATALLLLGCPEYKLQEEVVDTGEAWPILRLEPQTLSFGEVERGESLTLPFRAWNDGGAPLQVGGVALEGSGSFSLEGTTPTGTVAPGGFLEVPVRYTAWASDELALAWVASDDPATPQAAVELLGSALFSELEVSPSPLDFGYVEATGEATLGLTLTNAGDRPFTLDSLVVQGEGFTGGADQPWPLTLAPSDQATVSVTFRPPAQVSYEGSLWINHDADVAPAYTPLLGTAGFGEIYGRVCDPSGGGWVVGAYVWTDFTTPTGESRAHTWSGEDGWFLLGGVPTGHHTLYITKGSFSTSLEVDLAGGRLELEDPTCLEQQDLRIAVVTGIFDTISVLLEEVGLTYDLYDGVGTTEYLDLLLDPEALGSYDLLFLNCGIDSTAWTWLDSQALVGENLARFVEEGGSLYASDWSYTFVEAAWPDAIDFYGLDSDIGVACDGRWGPVTATVVDPWMQAAVGGDSALLAYDMGGWCVPVSAGEGSTPLVSADVYLRSEVLIPASPLVLRMEPGGTVIYTTFHNEAQASQDMVAALKEIILSL